MPALLMEGDVKSLPHDRRLGLAIEELRVSIREQKPYQTKDIAFRYSVQWNALQAELTQMRKEQGR